MSQKNKYDKVLGFPSPYVPNAEKNSDSYASQIFRSVLDSTSQYRDKRLKQTTLSRQYAKGEQSLRQYLDELNISGNKQHVNILFSPSRILQKFEKVVVDDYQQLEEKVKVISKSQHIKERKERKKSDLRFRMEFKGQIAEIEQAVGFPVEDPNEKVPEDEEELNLILSLNAEEREELLTSMMIDKVLEDNGIDSLKRMFTSDTFQVNFAGYHVYTDNNGKLRIKFVSTEDAIYDSSMFEDFRDSSFKGSRSQMTIGEIRYMFSISDEKEEELWKLARAYGGSYGNYEHIGERFNQDWRYKSVRPYDNYTVDTYHIWYKTVKNIGFTEGVDSYGKSVFDIDKDIVKAEIKSGGKKKTGVVYPETAYEGWFAGNPDCPVVLEWGEATNQLRSGENKEILECPYVFFMPENRGTMLDMSAVERVIPDIQMMDTQMLQIKVALANHPPSGYAIDHESLMDIDLGTGEDLQPVDIESIYQQTGRLYFRRKKDDNSVDNNPPIVPINISIADKINTHLNIYNVALNNVRDTLGINPNREGTANLNRVSTSNAESAIAVSQTATYYIYRAYLSVMKRLVRLLGIRIMDVLTHGSVDKGYLRYLGKENIDFIKEKDTILEAQNFEYHYNPQMTKEDKAKLERYIQAGISSRELSIEDALLIESVKDVELAEKYLRHLSAKNKKKAQADAMNMQDRQIQGQGEMAVKVEEAKRETFQIQSGLQANEWKIKNEGATESKILDIASIVLQAQIEGKTIPAEWQQIVNLVIDNIVVKQEKSALETEKQLEAEVQQEQQEQLVQQLQAAVQSGEITEQEAMEQMQNMGMA